MFVNIFTRYIETSQMSHLEEVFVSKASAKQRQGRAGRVREGICFRLYTKHKYDKFVNNHPVYIMISYANISHNIHVYLPWNILSSSDMTHLKRIPYQKCYVCH